MERGRGNECVERDEGQLIERHGWCFVDFLGNYRWCCALGR